VVIKLEDSLCQELIILTLNQENETSVDFTAVRLTESWVLWSLDFCGICE